MDLDGWLKEVSKAYELVGKPFSSKKKGMLLQELTDEEVSNLELVPQERKEVFAEALQVMTQYFFKKGAHGETFGDINRIRKEFGNTLEENYGLKSGPFFNMAKTYWTFKIEVDDISNLPPGVSDEQFEKWLEMAQERLNISLFQVLRTVETNIASVFFPTPGPAKIPVNLRRKTQRELLQEFAPEINIDRFLAENPILRAEAGSCTSK